MEFITENIDEDADRIKRRKERMEKMRQEKRRQMKRRKAMKRMIPLAALGVFVVGVSLVIANRLGEKKQEAVQSENSVVGEIAQADNGNVDKNFQTDALNEAEFTKTNADIVEETGQTETLGNGEIFQTAKNDKKESVVYSFEPTAETVSIYNEDIISENAILVDESTGTIVASKKAKERISPASMTKVLTILVAAENLTKEQLDDTFVITREITDYGYVNDLSAVGFLDGEKVTIKDLFYGTILPSGADAAVGLATYVAGSQEAFVEMMNEKLKELGLADTSHYTNCVGLYDKEHYSTVYDMAVIMKAAVENEFCKAVLSEHNYTTASTEEHPEGINISNWFLRRIEDKDTGGEVLCAKTGYVMQSKNCAVSYGTFADGSPYICVTAGSSSSWRCIYDHVEIYNQYVSV